MSLFHDNLRAFAAGVAVCCIVYAATALLAETRASIDNFTFKPETLTVPVGTTVAWENDDDIVHMVVALDGTFCSQALDTEDKFSFTFDKAGTFDVLHGNIQRNNAQAADRRSIAHQVRVIYNKGQTK